MFKKLSTPFLGFLQTSGLVAYIILITSFFYNIPQVFEKEAAEAYAPIIMLLLFVMSAVISATIVLGRSAVLFWDKKYREAFTLVGWTVGWGIMYFVLLLVFLSFTL